jgi:alpha-methylacyl-CoA racemase
MFRSRRSVAVDLKNPRAPEVILKLCEKADALFEGNRPGVTERLGVGPDACMARNPKLVYGRMTGWGQVGPLASAAGHDMNYISISGVLHSIGRRGEGPAIPLNLIGDFGGGLLCAYGMVCAMLEAQRSGKGQIVDAAMLDAGNAMMAMWWSFKHQGMFGDQRGTHLLDSGAHFYDVYETSDGKHVAVGSIEPQFYAILREKLQLGDEFKDQLNPKRWPELKSRLAAVFRSRTRDEWAALFDGTDGCVTPVLTLDEATRHPHNVARGSFVSPGGKTQPAPAPRFSRSQADTPVPASRVGSDTRAVLSDYGFAAGEIEALERSGTVAQAK